jgi:hypothetical protein
MKKTGWSILLTAALSYTSIAGAQNQGEESQEVFRARSWRDDFSVSIGTKLWFNQWTTWNIRSAGTGVGFSTLGSDVNGDGFTDTFIDVNGNGMFDTGDQIFVFPGQEGVITSNDSDGYEFVPIPVISVKYKELFVSASYFVDTRYDFFSIVDADRREWDVTTGYYILPPYLALTVGYKDIKQEFGPAEFKLDGPTVGFVGAVPMKWGFSLYSSFAYGFLEMESATFAADTRGDDDRDSQYWLVETGIAYTHDLTPANLLLNSATFYAGYRHQQVETDDVSIGNTDNDGLDVTRGMVIGLNLSF